MDNSLTPLVRDLVEWVAREPRAYADVLDAWRTSCPRLTVWEEAEERGLIERRFIAGSGTRFEITSQGEAFLARDAVAFSTIPSHQRIGAAL